MSGLKERPYFESMNNSNAIAAGASAAEAIKLTHKGGFPIIVRKLFLSYSNRTTNQESVRIAIKDNANDVYIVTEETMLGALGFDRASVAPRIPIIIHPEVVVSSGNDWTLMVWTDVNIAAKDLCLTWEGVIRF